MINSRQSPTDSRRRRDGSGGGLLGCLWGGAAEGQSSCLTLLVSLSLLLNVLLCGLLMSGSFSSTATASPSSLTCPPPHGTQQLSASPGIAASSAELAQLQDLLATWQSSHRTITEQFETLKQQYTELGAAHTDVRKKLAAAESGGGGAECAESDSPENMRRIEALESELAKSKKTLKQRQSDVEALQAQLDAAQSSGDGSDSGSCPPCTAGALDHSRLKSSDLSLQRFDLSSHEVIWTCDAVTPALSPSVRKNESLLFCPESATNEQMYQLQFFERPGAGSRPAIRKPKPQTPKCVQLPPRDYQFPKKVQSLPLAPGESAVHWPNLRVQKLEELLEFNRGTPKNLYHFNASFYDYEQEAILDGAAKYIPFGHKVRLMLDVGSGGASLGLLAKRRYDVQTVSTVFADWPYCEYISERGGLCMLLDAMEAMPFSKFTYDVVHSSWVFHALFTHQLRAAYMEQDRILRPGGYMWIFGGWSLAQVDTMLHLLVDQLGYKLLFEKRQMAKIKHSFDSVPFELEWTAILLKPVRADESKCVRVMGEKKK